jgi:hypothetical protein
LGQGELGGQVIERGKRVISRQEQVCSQVRNREHSDGQVTEREESDLAAAAGRGELTRASDREREQSDLAAGAGEGNSARMETGRGKEIVEGSDLAAGAGRGDLGRASDSKREESDIVAGEGVQGEGNSAPMETE